jgi:hypothetical protein
MGVGAVMSGIRCGDALRLVRRWLAPHLVRRWLSLRLARRRLRSLWATRVQRLWAARIPLVQLFALGVVCYGVSWYAIPAALIVGGCAMVVSLELQGRS